MSITLELLFKIENSIQNTTNPIEFYQAKANFIKCIQDIDLYFARKISKEAFGELSAENWLMHGGFQHKLNLTVEREDIYPNIDQLIDFISKARNLLLSVIAKKIDSDISHLQYNLELYFEYLYLAKHIVNIGQRNNVVIENRFFNGEIIENESFISELSDLIFNTKEAIKSAVNYSFVITKEETCANIKNNYPLINSDLICSFTTANFKAGEFESFITLTEFDEINRCTKFIHKGEKYSVDIMYPIEKGQDCIYKIDDSIKVKLGSMEYIYNDEIIGRKLMVLEVLDREI